MFILLKISTIMTFIEILCGHFEADEIQSHLPSWEKDLLEGNYELDVEESEVEVERRREPQTLVQPHDFPQFKAKKLRAPLAQSWSSRQSGGRGRCPESRS